MSILKMSPSRINLFNDCPRCFWLEHVKGIKKPRGIVASLPGGIDRISKAYFDIYRKQGILPVELDSLAGKYLLFQDQATLNKWRNQWDALSYESKVGMMLSGKVDDALQDLSAEPRLAPFDVKTKGSEPKQADAEKYYQTQLDIYGLLFEKNGYPITGEGFLQYYYPVKVQGPKLFIFETKTLTLTVDPSRAAKTCLQIVDLLKQPDPPEGKPGCEYCGYMEAYHAYKSG